MHPTMDIPELNGVYPPLITPFREGGDLDEGAFLHNIERLNAIDLGGYVVLGSNGEAGFLSDEEKRRLLELATLATPKGRAIIAGTGVESTLQTLRLTNAAATLGADAALVLTPHYYADQMTEAALIRHYLDIADRADIPIIMYNVPKFTHLNIPAAVVRECSSHPRIIGMKDSSGDMSQLAHLRAVVPDSFRVIVGTASAWLDALNLGVQSAIIALANCLPAECARVQVLHDAGDQTAARTHQNLLSPLNALVTSKYGIAGLKYACSLTGFQPGTVRAPLLPVSTSGQEEIRRAFQHAGFLTR